MPVGKFPTGRLAEDLKNTRGIVGLLPTDSSGVNNNQTTYRHYLEFAPFGGYGAMRYTLSASGADIPLRRTVPVTVYPENESWYVNNERPESVVSGVSQLSGQISRINGLGFPWNIVTYAMIADFGKSHNFRRVTTCSLSGTTGAYDWLDYSDDGINWTHLTGLTAAVNATTEVNFNARYIRYKKANSSLILAYQFWCVEQQDGFVEETIDKMVLLKRDAMNTADIFVDGVNQNYVGIILNEGTEFTLDTKVTGRARQPKVIGCLLDLTSKIIGSD